MYDNNLHNLSAACLYLPDTTTLGPGEFGSLFPQNFAPCRPSSEDGGGLASDSRRCSASQLCSKSGSARSRSRKLTATCNKGLDVTN